MNPGIERLPPGASATIRPPLRRLPGPDRSGGLRTDDIEVVLDDHDRVALVDQLVQNVEQLSRVLEMEPVVGSSRM
jgi:hypothetical protein